jgi:hypothetical protein
MTPPPGRHIRGARFEQCSEKKGKLYMKFIAGGTGTFGIFLTIKTDGG